MRQAITVLLGSLLVVGCVVIPIPTPHGAILEGTEVKQSDLEFMRTGRTGKSEVIRRLGTPTIVWRDENVLVYRWVQRKGVLIWLAAGGYSATGGAWDITKQYAYVIGFDGADRLESAEVIPIKDRKAFGEALLEWRDRQRSGSDGKQEEQS